MNPGSVATRTVGALVTVFGGLGLMTGLVVGTHVCDGAGSDQCTRGAHVAGIGIGLLGAAAVVAGVAMLLGGRTTLTANPESALVARFRIGARR